MDSKDMFLKKELLQICWWRQRHMKSCDECKLFINIGKTIILKDSSEHQKTMCHGCYMKMTKEQKKQYSFVEGSKINLAGAMGGFALGGIIGGAFGGSGMISGENEGDKKSQKEYGYTQKEMDSFSIDLFDVHTELLDSSKHRAVMDKFEGKTDSKYYRKYIQDAVQP